MKIPYSGKFLPGDIFIHELQQIIQAIQLYTITAKLVTPLKAHSDSEWVECSTNPLLCFSVDSFLQYYTLPLVVCSGILCGACQPGLSQVLSTSRCKKCFSIWLLLMLPFALAGVALVVCLMVLNLTVSTGMINGLIFYANKVRANAATFFLSQTANTIFIWLQWTYYIFQDLVTVQSYLYQGLGKRSN